MASKFSSFLLFLLALAVLGGCYTTPVRHLASDIALVQIGKSTQEDVVVFLGDPNEQSDQGDGVQKWLYLEKDVGLLQKTPLVGKKLGAPGIYQVMITFKNGVVSSCDFAYADEDDNDWAKDFSWQGKKK